jgi:hypothetical protein
MLFILLHFYLFSVDRDGNSTKPLFVAIMDFLSTRTNIQLIQLLKRHVGPSKRALAKKSVSWTKGFPEPNFPVPLESCNSLLTELQNLLERSANENWVNDIKTGMVDAYLEGQLGNCLDRSKTASQERNNIPRCFLSCLTYALVWVRLITNPTSFLYPCGDPSSARCFPKTWKLVVVSE